MSLCWSCLQFLCHFLSSGRIHMKWNHNSKETHVWISTMQARPVSKCLKMLRFFKHICSYLLGTHVECVGMCSPCSSMVFNERKLWGFCILQDGPLRQRAQRAAAQRVPDSEEGQEQQRAGCIGQAIWLVDFSGLVKWLEIPEFRNIMTYPWISCFLWDSRWWTTIDRLFWWSCCHFDGVIYVNDVNGSFRGTPTGWVHDVHVLVGTGSLQGTRLIWKAKWMICLEFDVR